MTNTRGPLPGRGGRPPLTGTKARSTKASRARTAAKKKVAAVPAVASQTAEAIGGNPDTWLAELASISWENFCGLCGHWRPLNTSDRLQVVKFWRIVQRYEQLAAHVAKQKPKDWFWENDKGNRGRAPEIVELRTLEQAIHDNATRFGLDPATRVRLGDDDIPKDQDDPFAAYLKQGMQVDAQAKDTMRQSAARGRGVRRPGADGNAASGSDGEAGTRKAQPRSKRTK